MILSSSIGWWEIFSIKIWDADVMEKILHLLVRLLRTARILGDSPSKMSFLSPINGGDPNYWKKSWDPILQGSPDFSHAQVLVWIFRSSSSQNHFFWLPPRTCKELRLNFLWGANMLQFCAPKKAPVKQETNSMVVSTHVTNMASIVPNWAKTQITYLEIPPRLKFNFGNQMLKGATLIRPWKSPHFQ